MYIESAKADIGSEKVDIESVKADIENAKSATAGGTIERVLTIFVKLPKTNLRINILLNLSAVFIMVSACQSAKNIGIPATCLQSQTVCTRGCNSLPFRAIGNRKPDTHVKLSLDIEELQKVKQQDN